MNPDYALQMPEKVIFLNYYTVSIHLFPLCLHPTGEAQSVTNPQAFEAARGSQFYRICFVVGQLKYQSTSVCPPPRIFGKLASCIIRDEYDREKKRKIYSPEFKAKAGTEE